MTGTSEVADTNNGGGLLGYATDAECIAACLARIGQLEKQLRQLGATLHARRGAGMTMDAFHAAMLALVDERMGAEDEERGRELRALADACVAYEAVMFPLSD